MASPNLHYERDRGSRRHNKVPACGRLGEARVLADHQRPQLRVRCAGQSWPASLRRFCCGSVSRHCNPSLCAERLKRTAIFQPRRRHRESMRPQRRDNVLRVPGTNFWTTYGVDQRHPQ